MTDLQIETERELIQILGKLNINSYFLSPKELKVWFLEEFERLYDELKTSSNGNVSEITDLEIKNGCFNMYDPIKSFQYNTVIVLAGQHTREQEDYSI